MLNPLVVQNRGSAVIMPDRLYATDNADFERLLSLGFTESEAKRLLYLRDHVDEQVEYREILEESRRLNFIRWLIEHDRISR
ncbi:hypothetical protein KTAU_01640 [Thermogemmatispora aurantia]|nr:hypothetical protein KTA_37350 [Thermogemmatispora argillosa]GER81526.1 hypothetical protein KTAU_01640 [Thermogemmatispora aurantia]